MSGKEEGRGEGGGRGGWWGVAVKAGADGEMGNLEAATMSDVKSGTRPAGGVDDGQKWTRLDEIAKDVLVALIASCHQVGAPKKAYEIAQMFLAEKQRIEDDEWLRNSEDGEA